MLSKKSYIVLFFFFNILILHGQYQVKSENIIDPDKNIEYVRNNANFWIKHAYDSILGGFYSSIDVAGKVLDYNKKSLIAQTRHGYGFTKAFMLTGDEKYLFYASKALNFLTKYGWDSTFEGWYTFAKSDGTIDNRTGWNPNNKKYGFQQHYAMLGLVANYEATRSQEIKGWIDKGLSSLNNNMWDSRPGYEGYYEDATLNWSSKTGKGFTPTVDAITTHAELSYLISNDSQDKNRLISLANIIVNRLVKEMDNPNVKVLFPGVYDANWVPNYNSGASIGHFIKTAWCLGRVYLCDTTNTHFRYAAIKILDKAWNFRNGNVSAWDFVNGGPFNQVIPTTGLWGTNGDSKDYWTVEQGFTGPMTNYYITGNPIYLQMADESMHFFMTHLVDKINGEIYSRTNSTGAIVTSNIKGDDFKASYHSSETGYLGYLYSKLYYAHKPATLYYKFEPTQTTQTIKLTPIPYQDELLKIKEVSLNNEVFSTFDKDTRTLNIPANVGGKFRVTFEAQVRPTNIKDTGSQLLPFLYPSIAKTKITVAGIENTNKIIIIDVSSKIIFIKNVDNNVSMDINVDGLNNGIYFIKLQSETGIATTLRFIKI